MLALAIQTDALTAAELETAWSHYQALTEALTLVRVYDDLYGSEKLHVTRTSLDQDVSELQQELYRVHREALARNGNKGQHSTGENPPRLTLLRHNGNQP